jgi:hypothetical protein
LLWLLGAASKEGSGSGDRTAEDLEGGGGGGGSAEVLRGFAREEKQEKNRRRERKIKENHKEFFCEGPLDEDEEPEPAASCQLLLLLLLSPLERIFRVISALVSFVSHKLS